VLDQNDRAKTRESAQSPYRKACPDL